MIRWAGLAPRELEFPLPGSFASTFQSTKAKSGGNCAPSVSMSLKNTGWKDSAEEKEDTTNRYKLKKDPTDKSQQVQTG